MKSSLLRALTAAAAVSVLALTGCSATAPSAVGSWGDASQTDQPSLELSQDGRVTGTDGCNRLMGGYSEDGDSVKFEQLASTMMFCEGVDTWLSKAATATVAGDTLTISDETGTHIGTLSRAS